MFTRVTVFTLGKLPTHSYSRWYYWNSNLLFWHLAHFSAAK